MGQWRALLGYPRDVIGTACRGSFIEARFALLDCERKPGVAAQWVAHGIRAWRAAKARRVQEGDTHTCVASTRTICQLSR
jgi:hypothetical protein